MVANIMPVEPPETTETNATRASGATDRRIILVPGLGNSGAGHWQTIWERDLPLCSRVDFGQWDDPHRNTWVNRLNLAVERADAPVVLVAHSLGCHVIAWWAEYERHAAGLGGARAEVVGALLVAPPDVEDEPIDRRLTRFAPVPSEELPFPSILVASRDDPYASVGQSRRMARRWGARFVDAGESGHINAQAGLGKWRFGLDLLATLIWQGVTHAEHGLGRQWSQGRTVNPPANLAPANLAHAEFSLAHG